MRLISVGPFFCGCLTKQHRRPGAAPDLRSRWWLRPGPQFCPPQPAFSPLAAFLQARSVQTRPQRLDLAPLDTRPIVINEADRHSSHSPRAQSHPSQRQPRQPHHRHRRHRHHSRHQADIHQPFFFTYRATSLAEIPWNKGEKRDGQHPAARPLRARPTPRGRVLA